MTLGGSISLHVSIRGTVITGVTWQGGVEGRSRPNLSLVWGGGRKHAILQAERLAGTLVDPLIIPRSIPCQPRGLPASQMFTTEIKVHLLSSLACGW